MGVSANFTYAPSGTAHIGYENYLEAHKLSVHKFYFYYLRLKIWVSDLGSFTIFIDRGEGRRGSLPNVYTLINKSKGQSSYEHFICIQKFHFCQPHNEIPQVLSCYNAFHAMLWFLADKNTSFSSLGRYIKSNAKVWKSPKSNLIFINQKNWKVRQE